MYRFLALTFAAALLAQETAKTPEPKPAEPKPDINLLGKTNSQSGESRRNENVQFNLIDNNALKELNIRLGTTATLIEDFDARRNHFGVEFGNAPSPVLHVSPAPARSSIHGMLQATHGNSIFSARSFFQAGPVQPARENQYGVAISLPAWRGAFLSFDGSQQKIRGNVNGNILVPRPDERTPLATDPGVQSLIQRWIDAYPGALPNRTDINERALNTNAPQSINTDAASARIDQVVSSSDRLVFRHAWTSQQIDAFQFVHGQNPDTTTKSHRARITWNRAWRPDTLLEVSTGFDRTRSLLMPEPNAVGPQVQIGTVLTALGPGSNVPLDRVQNRFRNGATLSMRSGRHRWTLGGEITRLQFNGREASSNRGNYYFRNDFGRDALTNFRLGLPSRYSTGIGDIDRGFRNFEQQYFAGDTIQLRQDLTVSAGIRFQPITRPAEINNRTIVPFDCDCNNWGPRAGLAWRLPRNHGVLRAAYVLEYGEIFAVTLQQLRWNPPDFQKIEVLVPPILDPLRDAVQGPNERATLFEFDRDLKTPYSHQYNVSWESQAWSDWKLQLGYVGSRTHKLFMMWHTNRAVPVPGIPQTTATINDRRPDPRYFEVRRIVNGSRSYFDAARATLIVPRRHGVSADVSYWFSKALDTGAAYTNTAAGDDARQGYSQSENLVAADLKGPSVFDQSHSLLVRFLYETPRRFGNLSLSAVWLAKTGLPFNIISGSDAPGFGNVDGTNGDRPDIIDPSILGRTIGHPDKSLAQLPRSAFRFIEPGTERGNLGVNAFRRGGIRNLNAAVARSWKVAGERVIALRAEAINLTNTPQFSEPNNDLTSPAFGKITNTLNDGRMLQFNLAIRF
jgi:hypothetical protein